MTKKVDRPELFRPMIIVAVWSPPVAIIRKSVFLITVDNLKNNKHRL